MLMHDTLPADVDHPRPCQQVRMIAGCADGSRRGGRG
jgi:hypothetical protein